MAVVGRTRLDVRRIMVEGRSGILKVCPPWNMPEYQSSNDRIVWPNGSVAYLYSAEKPDALRGPGHRKAWLDEIASWQYLDECIDNLNFYHVRRHRRPGSDDYHPAGHPAAASDPGRPHNRRRQLFHVHEPGQPPPALYGYPAPEIRGHQNRAAGNICASAAGSRRRPVDL